MNGFINKFSSLILNCSTQKTKQGRHRRCLISGYIIITLLLLYSFPTISTAQFGDAMWAWRNVEVIGSEFAANRADLINFCNTQNIILLYLWAGDIDSASSANWRVALQEFHAAGIDVYALLGEVGNIHIPANRDTTLGVVKNVMDYQVNTDTNPAQRFDGLHFNIEDLVGPPNEVIPRTSTTYNQKVQSYIDFMDKEDLLQDSVARVYDLLKNHNLDQTEFVISGDHGMHMITSDTVMSEPFAGGSLTNREKREELLASFDVIVFQSYVDRSRFFTGILEELEFLSSEKGSTIPFRTGLEFQDRFDGRSLYDLSFWWNGGVEDAQAYQNVRNASESIIVANSDITNFQGWALHTYDNKGASNKSLTNWLDAVVDGRKNKEYVYPNSMDFVQDGEDVILDPEVGHSFMNPVHYEFHVRAHPEYIDDFRTDVGKINFYLVGGGYGSETSTTSVIYCGVKSFEFYPGILGCESPVHRFRMGITRFFPRTDLFFQSFLVCNTTV